MWNRTGENTVSLPVGLTPEKVDGVHLFGNGKRKGTPICRRLRAFRASTEELAGEVTINGRGEEVAPKPVRRRVLDGGARFTEDGLSALLPGDDWPDPAWVSLTVKVLDTAGEWHEVVDIPCQ